MHSHLKTARALADLLDNKFRIGKFKFGLDPLISLFPFLGGLIPAALSFYIVWIGIGMRIPADKIAQMISNIVMDYLIGLIPIAGTIGDFVFKANLKNMEILEKYSENFYEGQVI